MRGFVRSVQVCTSADGLGHVPQALDLEVEVTGSNWTLTVEHVALAEWLVPGFEVDVVGEAERVRLERAQ